MMFVWKTTCRRLQTGGALVRFADGEGSARERSEIEAHLARCPACQAAVADALAVAGLLRASVPTMPGKSLAASGKLWATLESEIARTPQDKATSAPIRAAEPERRLQRFGQWLATPGALPFGAVAAAAVGLVGIAVYHQGGVTSETGGPDATVAMKSLDSAEISIIASPKPLASSDRMAKAAKAAAPMAARPAPVSVATQPHSEENFEIAPLQRKASVRQSPAAQRQYRVITEGLRPSAPREPSVSSVPSVQVAQAPKMESDISADASVTEAASDAAAAASAAPAISTPLPPMMPAAPIQGFSAPGNLGGQELKNKNEAAPVLPMASVQMAKGRMATAPGSASTEPGTPKFAGASGLSMDRNSVDKSQDISDASSLMDIVIQQRRQRTLFSYATR